MRIASLILAPGLLALALIPARAPTSAEAVLERALQSLPGSVARVGAFTWLEDCGIGVRLAPAPPEQGLPRLLAGDAADGKPVITTLYELGDGGFGVLQSRLEQRGGRLEATAAFEFEPRVFGAGISGNWTIITMEDGAAAALLDFAANGRRFAFMFRAQPGAEGSLPAYRDATLRDFILAPGVVSGARAPLLLEGRYAAVLDGWHAVGPRHYATTDGGWLGLRIFQVAESDFESLDALQRALEAELAAARFRPTPATRPEVAGTEGFLRVYFRDDGFLQRILYAKLDDGYIVALMQAPEAMTDELAARADRLAAGIVALGVDLPAGPAPMPFSAVAAVRCTAWQDGRRVMWGAAFDDARRRQALWRQDDIPWSITATFEGETVATLQGTANSSKALNPLVDTAARALEIPGEWTGRLDLELEVAGIKARAIVVVR